MPKTGYKPHNFEVIMVTADGTIFKGEDWMKEPQVFTYEKNKELCDDYARRVDPAYRAKERAVKRFERVAERRRELLEQRDKIDKELIETT